MRDSTKAEWMEAPSLADERPDELWWPAALLGAAARFGQRPGRSATLVLRARPGLVARARAIAGRLDVESAVTIEAAGPTISLTPGRRPTAPTSERARRQPASPACRTRRLCARAS